MINGYSHSLRSCLTADPHAKMHLTLWTCFLILFPFYILSSGLPQISTLCIIALTISVIFSIGLRFFSPVLSIVACIGVFTVYTIIVNLIWAMALGELSVAIFGSYYAFNFLVCLIFFTLHQRYGDQLLRVTLYALLGSVAIQTILSTFFFTSGSFRQSVFFNNPNQLGYYALLCATIFAVGSRRYRIHPFLQGIFYACAMFLVIISLSKAAIFSTLFLIIVVFTRRPHILLIMLSILTFSFYGSVLGTQIYSNLGLRVSSIGQNDDSLAGRGYDRIFNNPENLFFGAGEGAYERHDSYKAYGELHSSLGTLVFSYGIIGTFLFAMFLTLIVWQAGSVIVLYLLPIFLYGLTHQGLRFTLLWVLFAFIVCLSFSRKHMGTKYDAIEVIR